MNKLLALTILTLAASLTTPSHAVENMNTVISGKVYISGSSGGRTPLSDSDLRSLCEQGFTYVAYVYGRGSDKTITCGGGRTLQYVHDTSWQNPTRMLSATSEAIANGGKALIHCWYGVHASRFVAAVALNKYCGFDGDEAARWWRAGFSEASLGRERIAELSGKLQSLGSGRGGMSGCPSAR